MRNTRLEHDRAQAKAKKLSGEISMQDQIRLNDKVVLVTGGSRGVGKGISEAFLSSKSEVVICGRSTPETLPEIDGKKAQFISCDVREVEQIHTCIAEVVKEYGKLDVLVNNAGGSPIAEAATASPRFSEAIIKLNLIAPINVSQAANQIMQDQKNGGAIINIASVSTLRPSPGTAAYGAAKAGLVNLTGSLAIEWAPKVRVNAIVAGLTETEQSHIHYGDIKGIEAISKTIPMKRLANPKDIGNTCVFLASSLASYISGASIEVHGGGEKPAYLSASNS